MPKTAEELQELREEVIELLSKFETNLGFVAPELIPERFEDLRETIRYMFDRPAGE